MGKNDQAHGGRRRSLLIAAGGVVAAAAVVVVALSTVLSGTDPGSTGPPTTVRPTTTDPVTTPEPTQSSMPTVRPTGPASSRQPTSREKYEQAAKDELEQGLVAYNLPAQARVDEGFDVTVRVQRGTATVSPSLKTLPGKAPVVIENLPVGTYMRAELRGSGFGIEPLSDPLQLIDRVSEWTWRVTPQADGSRTLRLTLVVELNDLPLSNRTFDRTVQVEVKKKAPWYERARGLLDLPGVVTALVIAAILGSAKLARVWWLRRKAEEEAAAEDPPDGAPDAAPPPDVAPGAAAAPGAGPHAAPGVAPDVPVPVANGTPAGNPAPNGKGP
ncbi:hypothetical protein AB0L70_22295 [Kribbella sp. NPDC051952]|uniref:hypothetical protein n=1 Tax=Kribbella sp. NPDC051952 TaxID=3154851 RepID=UPI0034259503